MDTANDSHVKEYKHRMYEPPGPILPMNPADAFATLRSTVPLTANPLTSQLSYGRKAIPNLIRDLNAKTLPPQQRALVCLTELFHSPQNVSQGITEGIVPYLIGYLGSLNITCRQKASEALMVISNYAIGRDAIMKKRSNMEYFSKGFNDEDDLVRKQIHETIANLTIERRGVEQVLNAKMFSTFVKKVEKERLDIQVPILKTCYNCIRLDNKGYMPNVAIDADALEVMAGIASKSVVLEAQVGACECIMMLCFYYEFKRLASNQKIVGILLHLLSHVKASVRAAASGALMSISIDCDAKRVLVRENAVKIMSVLLKDENDLVLLNVIKAITNCAEDYRGRFQLHQSLDKLKEISETSKNQYVKEAAIRAIEVITWRP